MPANATVFRGTYLAPEVTKGVDVATDTRLMATSFKINPRKPKRAFRPVGSKANTTAIGQKEWTEGSFEGPLAYRDIAYLLSGLLETASIVTPTGAVLTRRWTWNPQNFEPDDYITYTIETGFDGFVERTRFGLINGMTVAWGREGVDVSGDLLCQEHEDDTVLSDDTPVFIDELPVDPDEGSIFAGSSLANNVWTVTLAAATGNFTLTVISVIDGSSFTTATIADTDTGATVETRLEALANVTPDDVSVSGPAGGPYVITWATAGKYAAIGVDMTADFSALVGGAPTLVETTLAGLQKLEFGLSAEWALSGRFNGEFTLDAAQPSFSREVELGPDYSASVILEADAVGVGFMDQLRDNSTRFFKWVFLGPIIELDFQFRIDVTWAFKFGEPEDRDDQDGVWGIPYTLIPIYNTVLGGWTKWILDTDLTSL